MEERDNSILKEKKSKKSILRLVCGRINGRRKKHRLKLPRNSGKTMAKVLVDSDVLIDIFRGNEKMDSIVGSYEGYINSVVYVELIQGENISRAEVRKNKELFK